MLPTMTTTKKRKRTDDDRGCPSSSPSMVEEAIGRPPSKRLPGSWNMVFHLFLIMIGMIIVMVSSSDAFSPPPRFQSVRHHHLPIIINKHHHPSSASASLLLATSSSDLKQNERNQKRKNNPDEDSKSKVGGSKGSRTKTAPTKKLASTSKSKAPARRRNVVSRLSQAAKQANEKRIREKEEREKQISNLETNANDGRSMSSTTMSNSNGNGNNRPNKNSDKDSEDVSSITDLFSIIDQELSGPNRQLGRPKDVSSMMQLLEFNDRVEVATLAMQAKAESSNSNNTTASTNNESNILSNETSTNHVAIVLSKPLVRDEQGHLQLSMEFATRFQTLATSLQNGYRPKLICICGNTTTHTKTEPIVSEVSMGVVYFQHLCAANNISLQGISIAIVPFDGRRSLQGVADVIQQYHLNKWWDESTLFERKTDEYGLLRREPRKKVHIHMTVVSTDYQLCQLYDIHTRSPRKSPFQTLRVIPRRGGIVDTGFSFHYASYPYTQSLSGNSVMAFLGNCYVLSQTMVPLLVNIQGVAEYMEFFQRDNYRALVSTRRTLLTLLEDMNAAYTEYVYQEKHNLLLQLQTDDDEDRPGIRNSQVSLKTQLQSMKVVDDTHGGKVSVDIALESAVLALGRCLDLVRPAGVQSPQSVPKEDWQQAAEQLEWFLDRMETICDPDVPLQARNWGKLSFRENNGSGPEEEYESTVPTTTFYCSDDDYGTVLPQQVDDVQDEMEPLSEWKERLQRNQVYKSFKELDMAFDREESDNEF